MVFTRATISSTLTRPSFVMSAIDVSNSESDVPDKIQSTIVRCEEPSQIASKYKSNKPHG